MGKIEWIDGDETPSMKIGRNSVALVFDGWSSDDCEGYELTHFFHRDGSFKGPDMYGIYPIFSIKE